MKTNKINRAKQNRPEFLENKSMNWENLKKALYESEDDRPLINGRPMRSPQLRSPQKPTGLEKLRKGKDYIILDKGMYDGKPWVAYQPLNWKASKIIASPRVEPSTDKRGKTIGRAYWSIADKEEETGWYYHSDLEAFIYLCGESIPTKKVAILISKETRDADNHRFSYSKGPLNYDILDFYEQNTTITEDHLLEIIPGLDLLIKKAYENWKKLIKTINLNYNPETGLYDYDGSLLEKDLKNYIKPDKDGFKINFGTIKGDFNCSRLGLTSLKGAPKEVGGDFDCSENELSSLEGSPRDVTGNFYCEQNQLTSLKGCPRDVGGIFTCTLNQLTSLEGSSSMTVGAAFDCDSNKLTSLKGAPRIGGSIWCSVNQLTSLEGAPQTVAGSFTCSYNPLTSLKGAPQTVVGSFDCSHNQLTSLEGAPQTVVGSFDCSHNQLTSLKGGPRGVEKNFDCSHNPDLPSLEGIGEVGGRILSDFKQKKIKKNS